MPEETIREQLLRGEFVTAGNRIYAMCGGCGKVVQLNKRIFGSMHICSEERAAADRAQQEQSDA